MSDENDVITRLARIEITQEHSEKRQEHTDKSLRDLNETTKKLVGVVHQLANQKDSIKRMHERQDVQEDKITENSREIFETTTRTKAAEDRIKTIEDAIKEYKAMEDTVHNNSYHMKLIVSVVSILFVAGVGVVTALVKGALGV